MYSIFNRLRSPSLELVLSVLGGHYIDEFDYSAIENLTRLTPVNGSPLAPAIRTTSKKSFLMTPESITPP